MRYSSPTFLRVFFANLIVLSGIFMITELCVADVRVSPVFSDHMVLQRDAPIPIWGEATPGERVEILLQKQHKSTTADAQGHWKVLFAPLKVGDAFEITIKGAQDTHVLHDVLVGEVWLCSGQSNMQLEVRYADDAAKNIAAANDNQLRLFMVNRDAGQKIDGAFSGTWTTTTPTTVADFSAVAYYFGQHLRQDLGVPVGLVDSSIGGSTAQSWTPINALSADAAFAPMLADNWKPWIAAHNDYDVKMEKWLNDRRVALAAGKTEPPRPVWPPVPFRWNKPGFLFEKMIAPLVPFSIRGVIWYQGESNAPRAAQYRKLFPTLIRAWRKQWNNDFPFLWVQLPNFKATQPQPSQSDWAELREAQSMTLSLPNTGMATTIDIGDAANIHPKNKEEVGRRLSLVALSKVYHQRIESSGPVFDSMHVEDGKVLLHWTHAGGLKTTDGGAPQGFALCGDDGIWHWATAAIEGETVVLSNPDVSHPVAVRYAWADNPQVNLINKFGLPAVPFRTDHATDITAKNTDLPANKA